MPDQQTLDSLFQTAVAAIDTGNIDALQRILAEHPDLVRTRLDSPGPWLHDKVGRAVEPGGFFERPYLLWFVAEDPVRNNRLPANIADVARLIIATARNQGVDSLQEQLDYAVDLVAWSWVSRECGVQIPLIDLLAESGADLDGGPENALVNGNVDGATRFVELGAELTLAAAICLGFWDEVPRLANQASADQKQFALVLAALTGQADGICHLLPFGVDVNLPSKDLYSHGTPLHHAVCSGSLATVRVLVQAGADPLAKDTAWQGTPLGWAEYYLEGSERDRNEKRYRQMPDIASYLREKCSDSA